MIIENILYSELNLNMKQKDVIVTLYRYRTETSLRTKPYSFWKFVRNNRANICIPKEMPYNEFTSSNEQ